MANTKHQLNTFQMFNLCQETGDWPCSQPEIFK